MTVEIKTQQQWNEMTWSDQLEYVSLLAKEHDVSIVRSVLNNIPTLVCYDDPLTGARFLDHAIASGNLGAIAVALDVKYMDGLLISQKQIINGIEYALTLNNRDAAKVLFDNLEQKSVTTCSWQEFCKKYDAEVQWAIQCEEFSGMYNAFEENVPAVGVAPDIVE